MAKIANMFLEYYLDKLICCTFINFISCIHTLGYQEGLNDAMPMLNNAYAKTMIQNGAKCCNIVQNAAKYCKMLQNAARCCKILQISMQCCTMLHNTEYTYAYFISLKDFKTWGISAVPRAA